MDRNTSSRLGGILIEKGMITRAQLEIAVQEQTRRRQSIDSSNKLDLQSTALGEVLIDLGFITRLQLKRSLNWQMLLRKMTIAMSLVAPLMTLGSPTAYAAKTTKTSSSLSSSSSSSSAASLQTAVTQASVVATPASLPLTIQAEDFTSMYGIQTEATTDTGGGLNTGWVNDGDWLSYSGKPFTAPADGLYQITFRIASPSGGGSFELKEGDDSLSYGRVAVPATGGTQNWVSMVYTLNMTAGTHSLKLAAMLRGSGFNLNWFKIEYLGAAMPATIQAESYDSSYGVETQSTTDAGGGLNVGWINDGDWMNYSNQVIGVPKTGTYKVTYRVASPSGGAKLALRDPDTGTVLDTLDVPATGGFQTWTSVEKIITLAQGSQKFGLLTVARGSGVNINWFKIEPATSASSSSTSSSTSSSSSTGATTSSSSSTSSQPSSSSSSAPGSVSSSSSSAPSSVSSSSSSAPSSVSSSSSSAPSSVSSSSSSSVASSSSSSSSSVAGSVMLRWGIPSARENGEYLDVTEIGGYELRYKLASATKFTYVTVDDAWQDQYTFDSLQGDYVFEVAVFDKNGLYSKFVPLTPL